MQCKWPAADALTAETSTADMFEGSRVEHEGNDRCHRGPGNNWETLQGDGRIVNVAAT